MVICSGSRPQLLNRFQKVLQKSRFLVLQPSGEAPRRLRAPSPTPPPQGPGSRRQPPPPPSGSWGGNSLATPTPHLQRWATPHGGGGAAPRELDPPPPPHPNPEQGGLAAHNYAAAGARGAHCASRAPEGRGGSGAEAQGAPAGAGRMWGSPRGVRRDCGGAPGGGVGRRRRGPGCWRGRGGWGGRGALPLASATVELSVSMV